MDTGISPKSPISLTILYIMLHCRMYVFVIIISCYTFVLAVLCPMHCRADPGEERQWAHYP